MRHPLLAALIAGLVALPVHAETYEDKSLPLYLATPDGFAIRAVETAGYDLFLHIDSAGDFPRRPAGETRLCDLSFKPMPSQDSQQALNARWKNEEVLALMRLTFKGLLQPSTETPFALGDVAGMEYVGPLRRDPTVVSMASLVYTPRGEVQMVCSVLAEQADKALPLLRSIRNTIRPPK